MIKHFVDYFKHIYQIELEIKYTSYTVNLTNSKACYLYQTLFYYFAIIPSKNRQVVYYTSQYHFCHKTGLPHILITDIFYIDGEVGALLLEDEVYEIVFRVS